MENKFLHTLFFMKILENCHFSEGSILWMWCTGNLTILTMSDVAFCGIAIAGVTGLMLILVYLVMWCSFGVVEWITLVKQTMESSVQTGIYVLLLSTWILIPRAVCHFLRWNLTWKSNIVSKHTLYVDIDLLVNFFGSDFLA